MPLKVRRRMPVKSTGKVAILLKIPLTSYDSVDNASEIMLEHVTENPR